MVANPDPANLKSSRILVETIAGAGLRVELLADAAERDELTRLNGAQAVDEVRASLLLRNEPKGGVWLTGEVRGSLVQTCVVSLEPFVAEVIQPVDLHFLPPAGLEAFRAAQAKRLSEQGDADQEDVDEPDPIINGRIDLGAIAAEIFTLGVDLYPRKPGVVFDEPAAAVDAPEASPFAALQALKHDKT